MTTLADADTESEALLSDEVVAAASPLVATVHQRYFGPS